LLESTASGWVEISLDYCLQNCTVGGVERRCSIGGRLAIIKNEIPPLLLLPYLFD
jgi:hypothetical protein